MSEPRPESKPEPEKRHTLPLPGKLPLSGDVLILERRGNILIPVWGKINWASRTITTKDKRMFVVPQDYRPVLLYRKRLFRRQAVLAFLADEKGNLVEWSDSGMDAKTVDPQFLGTILNTEILRRLASTVYIRATDIISWLFAGLGLAFILIFIVFPMLGIHVQIGSQPIVVQPRVTIQQPSAPPPGNYTIAP